MDRLTLLNQFYQLLAQAKAKFPMRPLKELTSSKIPTQVVYYFFDTEQRRESGLDLKVIRVGTHAARKDSNAIAYGRLSQHRGTLKGYGNHRASVFRYLVGSGLIKKDLLPILSWGEKNSKCFEELEIEKAVSEYLCNLLFTVIEIPGPSHKHNDRAFIERNSIALLSNYLEPAIDRPTPAWLGYHTENEKISGSGLWNSDFVDHHCPDISFTDKLYTFVQQMKCY